jgi:hypothetical protein
MSALGVGRQNRRGERHELAESFLLAARQGEWRAAEALMNRIYGKSHETVINHIPPSPAHGVIASMTLEEKLELLHSLRRGEVLDLPAANAPGRIRTCDPRIRSPPLCPLSYGRPRASVAPR